MSLKSCLKSGISPYFLPLQTNLNGFQDHIVSEFEKLHTFLKERQEKLLEELQEQGESLKKDMESNLVKMQENRDNIQQTIGVAKERMDDTDSISFLTVSESSLLLAPYSCQTLVQ